MPPPSTRIILLGRIAIERGEAIATGSSLAGRRSEIVFAYLALEHRRTVSRDELADALWPELLPDTWNAALRGVLSDVRRFLERAGLSAADTLVTEQGRLRLHLPAGAVVDVDEARADLAEARRLLAADEPAASGEAATRAADAAALPFLSFHDEGWAAGVRDELDRIHIEALGLQGAAFAAAGDLPAALAAADRLVRADPFLESAHRLRITMYGATGDRAGALKAYERCKTLLAAELGIDPSPETDEVLRAALAGVAAAAPPVPDPAHAGRSPEEPTPRPTSAFGALSVLVVEDHDFQRRTTLALLRGLGVRTLAEAPDGRAALGLLDERPAPDVIVCDIDMPGMDGVEFIRKVAERRLASAVVIASGLDERVLDTVRAASEGYGLQVLGAMGKPLTAAALETMLASYRPRRAAPDSAASSPAVLALLTALEDGTLGAEFEPIVDLAVGQVTGIRSVVARPRPENLRAAADRPEVARRLVEHLLARGADAAFERGLELFVDLCPSLLTDVSLADGLAAIARERVVLVAGASALATHSGPAMFDVLARLRVKGFGLCADGIDAPALERLPLTHVQLATDLVVAAAATGDAAPLAPAIEASRSLGIPMLGRCATEAQFDILLQVGCSFASGPFLAPRVPASELAAVARDWAPPSAVADGLR